MGKVEEKVKALAEEAAVGRRFEVSGVELLGGGRRRLLRITLDREGGVTLDDCETFSRDIGALLDVEDPIKEPYTLEVSSPGLDRPLRGIEDFRKNTGKLVRVVTKQKVLNRNFFLGRLVAVEDGLIRLRLEGDKQAEILLDNVSRARLEAEIK